MTALVSSAVDTSVSPLLRIASVPADHVYVRHLSRPDRALSSSDSVDPIGRLADPTRPWWPPTMLDASWVELHADTFDVFHIHFGFDACAPSGLRDLVRALQALGKPIVQTVHDLRNPHHETRAAHDEHLDILIPAADALITLTPGAAAEIHRRWGRAARVIPHPHVVDLAELERREGLAHSARGSTSKQPPQRFTVGVHLKSMRPCMSGPPVLAALMDAVDTMGDAVLRVDVHCDVADDDGARHDPVLVEALRDVAARGAEVHVHDFFSDLELWDYLASLDLSVLPYRYGTHSGWLEACRDLGTGVLAPTCGYYDEQGPVHPFGLDESGLDEVSLARAVWAGRCAGRPAALTAEVRRAQRQDIAAQHEAVYRELLA